MALGNLGLSVESGSLFPSRGESGNYGRQRVGYSHAYLEKKAPMAPQPFLWHIWVGTTRVFLPNRRGPPLQLVVYAKSDSTH